MTVVPCSFCGYDAPTEPCPHCGGASADASLAGLVPAGWGTAGLGAGLAAFWRGIALLATTRGTKRWLVPPFVLTTVAFGALFAWAWQRVELLVERAKESAGDVAPDASWFLRALDWVLETWAFVWAAKLGAGLVFLVVGFFAALYAFSLFYEAVAGPFLDEVQGRIETRWFGRDPRNAIERPTALSTGRAALSSALAALLAATLGWVAWRFAPSGRPWWIALALLAPFGLAEFFSRGYLRWLAWALRVELSTLWTSVRTSAFALAFLVFCLPLKFVPFVGPVLFAGAAGFATAISLLDIPFSRRRWNLGQRLSFLAHHATALSAFGVVASLFFLIPFAGPVLMVPAASIGGLWLFVRLDKSRLRLHSARIAARIAESRNEPPASD